MNSFRRNEKRGLDMGYGNRFDLASSIGSKLMGKLTIHM